MNHQPTKDNAGQNPPKGKPVLTTFKTVAAKTFEFFNRFVPTIENKSTHVYLYGTDDLLPNNNLRMINDCGVAKRCVRKKARYIQGDGFTNEDSAKFMVNDNQTADQLLSHQSSYAAYNEGITFSVQRKADGTMGEVKALAFECVRKMTDGNFTYNPKKGQCDYKGYTSESLTDTTYHPAFFGVKATPDQLKLLTQKRLDGAKEDNKFYKSTEIFYVYEQTADNPNYPVPDYNAGIEDIQNCIEISKVDLECVQNGFMPSGILTTQEIDNVNKGDDNKTPYDHFEEELKKFTGQKKDANGMSGRFKLLHMMVSNIAEAPTLQNYDAKSILEASNTKRDIIAREVCRLFGVHPILVGFSDAVVLGNTQALSNVIVDFNNYVNPIQRMISQAFKTLYPDKEWMISQHNPITYIPAEVWAKMTDDEIRNVVGLAPLEKKVSTEAENTLNAINSISPLVANKVLESLTEEEIRALIGLKAKVPATNGTTKPIPSTNGTDN